MNAKKLAGVDIGYNAVQLSIYDVSMHEMEDVYLPLDHTEKVTLEKSYAVLSEYMRNHDVSWNDFQSVVFSLEDASTKNRKELKKILGTDFMQQYQVSIITRFRAFAEYIFRQDRVKWENNSILFDYNNPSQLSCILVERILEAKQKAYRVYSQVISLSDFGIHGNESDAAKDQKIAEILKVFLVQHSAQVICLTGDGFDGNWMRKTKSLVCANGREVLRGSSVYANGAALMNGSHVDLMEEGLVLMSGPDMVQHTVGIMTTQSGKGNIHIPITTIGREWYNTHGSIDIILDKSNKVDIFYYNAKENMMQSVVCELKDLPKRPEHTTRIRVSVMFSSALKGVVLLQDMGFGSMFPATGKVTVVPFSLIS